MVPRPYRVFLWAGPFVLLTWLVVAFSDDAPQNPFFYALIVGLFGGTTYGYTTLAAAWSAFGPGLLFVRLPLSLLWMAMLPVAILIHLAVNGAPIGLAIPFGIGMLGQWLLLQCLFWGLALGWGLRLQHCDDGGQQSGQVPLQFTIRQLLVVTAVAGVVFGIGRLAIPALIQSYGGLSIFVLLAAAEVVLTVPLVFAALLRRFTIPGILLTLLLLSTATLWEMPLLALDRGASIEVRSLIAMNVGTALIMLVVLIFVRLNGYSLVTTRSAAKE